MVSTVNHPDDPAGPEHAAQSGQLPRTADGAVDFNEVDPGLLEHDLGEDPQDDAPASPRPARKRAGGGTNMLAAAMLAVGDILEPDKSTVEIVQTDDDDKDPEDLLSGIAFGDLPPLD